MIAAGHPKIDPFFVCFTDSSFHDCDDARSTGGYLTLLQGGIVDMNSFVPDPIAMSTCEAESNAQCIAIMASRHINKMVMEILTGHPDTPFTLPLFTDNKSSINLAESDKRTKASRHIERRFQYVRHAVIRGLTALYFVAARQGTSKLIFSHRVPSRIDSKPRSPAGALTGQAGVSEGIN